jgi:MFS family permease
MAFRTRARILLAALGVAALAAASQLGVGYGLGIVRLTRVFDAAGRDQWTAQLAWVAWFAMVAAVVGALAGGRFHQRWSRTGGAATARPIGLWAMIAIAAAAGVGATTVVPLTMQPARTAMVTAVNPAVVIGICAGLGALVGVFAGYAALAQLMARWSFGTMIGAVWLIAVVSVLPSLGLRDRLPAVRLGVFDAGFLTPATTQRFALFTMPALALLTGAALGWAARRRELPPMTIALAGLPGPALVMLAYLIAGPGEGGQRYQVIPYWAAMAAAGTGVLGAVIAAMIRRGTDAESDDPSPTTAEEVDDAGNAAGPAGTPTISLPAPLPGSATEAARPARTFPLPRRATHRPDPADADPPAGPFGPPPGDATTDAGTRATSLPGFGSGTPHGGVATGRPDRLDDGAPASYPPPRPAAAGPGGFVSRPAAAPAAPPVGTGVPFAASPAPAALFPPARPGREPDPAPASGRGSTRGEGLTSSAVPVAPARAFGPRVPQPEAGPPESIAAPPPGGFREDGPSRRSAWSSGEPVRKKDADYVDWVSGLGGD